LADISFALLSDLTAASNYENIIGTFFRIVQPVTGLASGRGALSPSGHRQRPGRHSRVTAW